MGKRPWWCGGDGRKRDDRHLEHVAHPCLQLSLQLEVDAPRKIGDGRCEWWSGAVARKFEGLRATHTAPPPPP